jgi:hypothetical protein
VVGLPDQDQRVSILANDHGRQATPDLSVTAPTAAQERGFLTQFQATPGRLLDVSRIGVALSAGLIAGSMLMGASIGAAATGLVSASAAVANVAAATGTAASENGDGALDEDRAPEGTAPVPADAPAPAPTDSPAPTPTTAEPRV